MVLVNDSLGIDSRPVEKNGEKGRGAIRNNKSAGNGSAGAQDTVVLSDRSKEAVRAAEVLAATPLTRQEKIDEIKERIANNEYHVPADKVAQRMIVDFLRELT
jgi:flagellar biosynthesis anti-sigma factor FlgM